MQLRSWTSHLMMSLAVLAVCILVPAGFILSGSFAAWLRETGIHASPNLADGYPVAEFSAGGPFIAAVPPGIDERDVRNALSFLRFSVKKVAFRRFSGLGIAPRINLCFEFDGQLPDPHNSSRKFSMTVIHVYIKAPGKATSTCSSDKMAHVDLAGMDWSYQVIIDGLHEEPRIYDTHGNLVARGLGLYVEYQGASERGPIDPSRKDTRTTRITAALPLEQLGDPTKGNWQYAVLAGLADSRNPTMMLHAGQNGSLGIFSGAIMDEEKATSAQKPILRRLLVNNPI